MFHDHKNLDALIEAAKQHPTPDLIQKLIDLELDYNGNWVGHAMATYLWHKLLPVAA